MKASSKIEARSNGCLIGVVFLIIGAIVFISIPVIGWVAGPIIAVAGVALSGTRRKTWSCEHCEPKADPA